MFIFGLKIRFLIVGFDNMPQKFQCGIVGFDNMPQKFQCGIVGFDNQNRQNFTNFA